MNQMIETLSSKPQPANLAVVPNNDMIGPSGRSRVRSSTVKAKDRLTDLHISGANDLTFTPLSDDVVTEEPLSTYHFNRHERNRHDPSQHHPRGHQSSLSDKSTARMNNSGI